MLKNRKRVVRLGAAMLGVALVLTTVSVVSAAGGPPQDWGVGSRGSKGTAAVAQGTQAAQVPQVVDSATEEALIEAINEEYGAWLTYEAVIEQFGPVQPFVSIARSEQRHIAALERLFDRYGFEVPPVPEISVPEFESLEDACELGVQAEIADAALYDELFEDVSASNVIRVFTNLQNASLNQHLPAFEACLETGS